DAEIVGALSDAARRAAAEAAGSGPTSDVWHRLQLRRTARSRPPWRSLLVLSAGVTAAIALLLVGRSVQRARPLTYVAQGADEQDGYIRGSGDGQSQVQFSDGT